MIKKAIILLSGGLDSATVLAIAKQQGYACYALTFDYGQKHAAEIQAAKHIAALQQVVEHRLQTLDLRWLSGSPLLDSTVAVTEKPAYVPARNTIFLAIALAWAEAIDAQAIFIGGCQADYAHYPDCRDSFYRAFEELAMLGTQSGSEGKKIHLYAPLLHLSKAEIIQQGRALGVDYEDTVTCYRSDAQGRACGDCLACQERKKGFDAAAISDPTHYG